MSLIHNERTKLLANALDRTSTAAIAVGLIAPLVGNGFARNLGAAAGVMIWLFAAVALHLMARHVLGALKQ